MLFLNLYSISHCLEIQKCWRRRLCVLICAISLLAQFSLQASVFQGLKNRLLISLLLMIVGVIVVLRHEHPTSIALSV